MSHALKEPAETPQWNLISPTPNYLEAEHSGFSGFVSTMCGQR